MSGQANTGDNGIGACKDAFRRRSHSLLAGVSLLALAAAPALAEDWQQRLRNMETGAAPSFDLGPIQIAQVTMAESRRFDIPAGDLQSALLAFSQTVDLQLLYPAEMTAGLATQGVQGEYTPEEALRRLLDGTGMTYRYASADAVTIERAAGRPDPKWLRPVIVTPKRVGEADDPERYDRIDPISRLTREQFGDLPNDRRLSDVMDRMPGVFFRGPVGVNRDIKFRGLDKGFNRFELDGIQLPGVSGERDFRVNRLSPLEIDVIEILRNPGASYEGDGIAGRIEATSRPIPDELKFELEALGGGVDTLDGSFRQFRAAVGDRPNENYGYNIFIDQARTPREKDKTKTTFDAANAFKEQEIEDETVIEDSLNLSGQLAVYLGDDTFRLKPKINIQESAKDKRKDKIKPGKDVETEFETGSSDDMTAGATLEHERKFNGGVLLKSDLSGFLTTEDADKLKRVFKGNTFDKQEEEVSELDDYQVQLRSSARIPIDYILPQDFHTGFQLRNRVRDQGKTKVETKADGTVTDKTEPGDSFTVDERLYAGFIESELFFSDNTSIKPGVRVETLQRLSEASGSPNSSTIRTDVLPSLQFRHSLDQNTVVKAAVSKKLNRPKFEEVVPFSKEKGDRFEVGNPDVQPAEAWNFDLEVTHATKSYLFSALLFRKEISNVIDITKTNEKKNGKDVFQVENVGDGWVHGLELEQRINMQVFNGNLDGLVLWANEGIYDSELTLDDTGEKQPFAEQRKFLLNAGADYQFPDKRTKLNIAAKYLGSLTKVKAVDEREVEDSRLLIDVGLRHTVTPNITVTFDVINVFDPDQDKNLFKGTDTTFDSETSGRVFFLGLQAKF